MPVGMNNTNILLSHYDERVYKERKTKKIYNLH